MSKIRDAGFGLFRCRFFFNSELLASFTEYISPEYLRFLSNLSKSPSPTPLTLKLVPALPAGPHSRPARIQMLTVQRTIRSVRLAILMQIESVEHLAGRSTRYVDIVRVLSERVVAASLWVPRTGEELRAHVVFGCGDGFRVAVFGGGVVWWWWSGWTDGGEGAGGLVHAQGGGCCWVG